MTLALMLFPRQLSCLGQITHAKQSTYQPDKHEYISVVGSVHCIHVHYFPCTCVSIGMNESSNISRELFPRDDCGVEQAVRRSTEQEGGRSLGVDLGEDGKNECGDMTVERARVNGDGTSGCGSDLDLVLKAMASLTISGGRDEGEREEGVRENKTNVETISDTMTKSKCVVGNSPLLPTSQPTCSMETKLLNSSAHSVNTDRVPGSMKYDGSNILGGGKRNTFLLG